MKRRSLLLFALLILGTAIVHAQSSTKPLKKILELKIPREGGANGAAVAWHPVLKKYYAAMAGNVSFCLGVFDVTGKRLSDPEQTTFFDVRGLWYNPNTKTLQMNGYNEFGWAAYKLNSKGFPDTISMIHEGMNQPDEQSAGSFNPKEKVVYFLNAEGNIDVYEMEGGEFREKIELTLGKTKKEAEEEEVTSEDNEEVLENYNSSIAVYTGIKGEEISLLNYLNKEIELYNIANGHLTRKLSLPDDAPAEAFLNFSYSNGIYWLFDKTERIWKGFK